MSQRGKVIRDTNAGPGLIVVDGQQHTFNLEGIWKGDVAPTVNMAVDVEFASDGSITSVRNIADSQLAKEQAAIAMNTAKEKGTEAAKAMVAKFGIETLVGLGLLAVSWFVLSTVSIQISAGYKVEMTFWKVLSLLNASGNNFMNALNGNSGVGFYGFLAIVAFAGPLLPFFWKDARAVLGNVLPLLLISFVAISIWWGIHESAKQASEQAAASANLLSGLFGNNASNAAAGADAMISAMGKQIMQAVHLGIGAYLAIVVSLYFAGKGAIKFMASRA